MAGTTYFEDTGYADDADEVGHTTAQEQTTGSKNGRFTGMGRGISVPVYQWLIVVGAVALLWGLKYGLISDIK
jgi:hypothetical protein